jgi:hypothetical protein
VRRHAVDAVGQRAIGEAVRAIGQRFALGLLAHAAGQHARQRLVAPQAEGAPARGHGRRQARLECHCASLACRSGVIMLHPMSIGPVKPR